ncbi:MAG: adenylate/guanylate cyclase domain-containing protein [Desulfuromonadales bacterium]|nr:adenylate/guanylate cyclase domain-containing protein [Desulfuromonadales bacterium]
MRTIFFHYRVLGLVVVALLAFLLYTVDFDGVNKFALQFEDLKFGVRGMIGQEPEGSKDIVIVTVDERSVNQLGRWPWDRRVIGDLLARLQEADLVGLDIVFSEPTDAAHDGYLAEKIAGNENIVGGFFFRNEASKQTDAADLDILQDYAYLEPEVHDSIIGIKDFPYAEINIPVISDAFLTAAYFNSEPDPDGLYRRYPLAFIHEGYVFPPLAVQLLRFKHNQAARIVLDRHGVAEFGLGDITLQRDNYFRLNYYRPDQSVFIPALEVYNGTVKPEFFRNKIVLVGVTEIGVFDMRPTPVDPVTPGVWLHYVALSNLMLNEMLHNSPLLDAALIAVALLLSLAVSLHRSLAMRLALYTTLLGTVLIISNLSLLIGNLWQREFYALFPALLLIVVLEISAFVRTEVRAGELKRAFTSYVSPEVVGEIINHPDKLELGGEEREISILFSDIRGFTSLSEQVTPTELVKMLTQIHDPMTQVIMQNKGLLDKYIGDAMMALFNAPLDVPDHADRAVRSALELVAALTDINRGFREQGFPPVDVGVGVNTGRCIVGNMGSKARFEYTAIGDAVNLASRLEGLCKTYHSRVVISAATKEQLTGDFVLRMLDRVRVKGKNIPVEIYEVMADCVENRMIADHFNQALDRYFARDFNAAGASFTRLASDGDRPAEIFKLRCEAFISRPPDGDWDGVYTLKSK